jgi:hypothetical protein
MAKSDNAATIAAVAAKVQTVGQARAALGKAADLLREGYTRIDAVGAGVVHDYTPLGFLEDKIGGIDELKAACRDRLDVVNAYAGGIYATLSAADAAQAQLLEFAQSQRTALALAQAQGALKDVEDAAAEDYWDIAQLLTDAIVAAAAYAGQAIQAITNAAGRAALAFGFAAWPTLLIVGALVALYVWWRYFRRRSA